MSKTLTLSARTAITNTNFRQEFHGDEKALGVDIDLLMDIPLDKLSGLEGSDLKLNEFAALYWDRPGKTVGEAAVPVKWNSAMPISFLAKANHKVTMFEALAEQAGTNEPIFTTSFATVKKLSIKSLLPGNHIKLALQVQCEIPPSAAEILTEGLITDAVFVQIEPQVDDLAGMDDDGAE